MRESVAAAALIRNCSQGKTLWLARWNHSWHRYHLVGGHKRPEESFRQCLVREIGEELGFHEGPDYAAAEQPAGRVEFVAWSERAQEQTAYTTELFEVQVLSDRAKLILRTDQRVRWLSEEEIRSGCCAGGGLVSSTMGILLSAVNWGRSTVSNGNGGEAPRT